MLEGGNRQTLLPSSNRISGSRISAVGRIIETAAAAIKLSGVGASAIGNRIVGSPHIAIFFEGNEHLIADNDIEGACLDTDDSGAIYAGADWTYRGNVVRGNTIAHVRGAAPRENRVGIYLDDMLSGTVVEENLLIDTQRGVLIGGGRDNRVRNNLFVATDIPIHVDGRALGWAAPSAAAGGALRENLQRVPHASTRWRDAYPDLANILRPGAASPADNIVENNFSSNGNPDEFATEAVAASRLALTRPLIHSEANATSLLSVLARCRKSASCRTFLP
jgi:nitrous oxidase accessory protein NosD